MTDTSTETAAAPRYCAACKHCARRGPGEPSVDWQCTAPQAHRIDVVTGQPKVRYCVRERQTGCLCGPNGDLFEAVNG
jgi:hypothetical protein